ncbi:MAG: MG2 domain-containing protein, partial [Flavitalea sp.]
NDKDPSALIDADLNRIIYVQQNGVMENKDSLYIAALQNIISNYRNHSASHQASYLMAQHYAGLAGRYNPKTDTANRYAYTKTIEILKSVLADTTASEGRSNALNLLNDILKPTINLQSESVNSPGLPFRLLLNFRNLEILYGRIIKLDDKIDEERWNIEYWEKISKIPAIRNIEQRLPVLNDYQQHSTEIKIDALDPGNYGLLVSTENNFEPGKQEQLALLNFRVSGIAYFNKDNVHFVANRETGTPIQNATIEEAVNSYNQASRKYEYKVTNTFTSDKNGSFTTPKPIKEDYTQKRFTIKLSNDVLITGKETDYIVYRENNLIDPKEAEGYEEKNLTSFLFSDRSVYRPGQTVFFKGILTTKDFQSKKNKVVAGKSLMVTLYDANDEEIDSLLVETNEFGSYSGKFQLPSNLLNGSFRIEDEETGESVEISVEEYKRPKFKTELVKPVETFKVNDSISVKGFTTAFAGNSISNAKVNYRVRRMARYPIWRSYYSRSIYPRQESQEIIHGTTTTDAGGNFTMAFKAIPDLKIDPKTDPIFSYTVSVDVTDINGETHGASQIVDAGYKSFQMDIEFDEQITVNELPVLKINTSNLNEQPVTTSVKVELHKLETPLNNFRERYWEEPDVFVMNENEYRKNFPSDIYKNENDPFTWKSVKSINLLTDSIKGSKKIVVSDRNLEAGYYLVNIEARHANGELLNAKRILKVSGKDLPMGMATVQILTSTDTLEAGNKFSYDIVSNLPSVMVKTQEIENNDVKPVEHKTINGSASQQFQTTSLTKRFRIDMATVY